MSMSEQQPARARRQPRAATREAVLRAAVRTFGEHGFAQSSLEQVAAAAGLSRGAVYSNFASKDELFLALFQQTIGERLHQISSTAMAQDSASGAGRAMSETFERNPEVHLLLMEFWMRAARDEGVREHFLTHRLEIRAAVVELLLTREADWGTRLPLPADELAIGVVALFNGFGLEHLMDPDDATPDLFGRLLAALLQAPPG